MPKQLPPNPNLEYEKKQAKALLKAYSASEPQALERVRTAHPKLQNVPEIHIPLNEFKLSDAQLVIAREYDFSSWPQLKHHIETTRAGLAEAFKTFAEAVHRGQTTTVRDLLKNTPNLSSRINDPVIGFDAPAIVIAHNNRELVDVLLQHGADINVQSVWWAGGFGVVHNTEPEVLPYLMERGAKLDVFAAAEHNLLNQLRIFIEADPTLVHAKGPDGQRPLHFARSTAVIDYLLEHGADINARDIDHRSTAAQWIVDDHPTLCRYLIEKGADVDIFMVCALGDRDRMIALIDADPEVLNKRIGQVDYPPVPPAPGLHIYTYVLGDNTSPHQVADKYGYRQVYQLLLERSSPQRRFIAACERADAETARALLKAHPDLAATLPSQDQRLLADAAWNNEIESVKVMLEAGFDPHVRGADASTPLDRAAFHGFSEMVNLLLRYNPLLPLQNCYGSTPLGSAVYGSIHSWRRDNDFPATVDALIKAGSVIDPAMLPSGNDAVDAVLRRYLSVSDDTAKQ